MSDAARWMIAFAFISLPSIAFGGYFLLSILANPSKIGQRREQLHKTQPRRRHV